MLHTPNSPPFDPQDNSCLGRTEALCASNNSLPNTSTNTLSSNLHTHDLMDELYLFEAIPFNPSDFYEVENTCTSTSDGSKSHASPTHDNLYVAFPFLSAVTYFSSPTNGTAVPMFTPARKENAEKVRTITKDKQAFKEPGYADRIYEALVAAPDNAMSLSDLYQWFKYQTTKTNNKADKVWQRSIRHNLSRNPVGPAISSMISLLTTRRRSKKLSSHVKSGIFGDSRKVCEGAILGGDSSVEHRETTVRKHARHGNSDAACYVITVNYLTKISLRSGMRFQAMTAPTNIDSLWRV